MKSCMQPLAVLVAAVSLCAAGADALPKFPGKRTVEFANPVNPIVPEGLFFCDPAARVGPDGTLWIIGTRDEVPTSYTSHYLDALETKDLKSWHLHRSVFASNGEDDRIPESDAVMYDSNAIFHNGKWWLLYCLPDKRHMMGVSSAPSPAGPYTMGRRFPECSQISPSIFRDDDGTLYYVWGQFTVKGAVMKDDFSGLDMGTFRADIIDEAYHNFHENIQLTKRNGIYYMVYADIGRRNAPTCLGYATAEKPFGPYTYRGVIIDNYGCDPASWNNAGEIVELGGRWYIFYHRASNGSKFVRKICAEPIEFDKDGMIAEVEMTSNGIGPLLDPFAKTPARIACVMHGEVRVATQADGTERLSGIRAGDGATWRYFTSPGAASAFVVRVVGKYGGYIELKDAKGASYGIVAVPAGDGKTATEVRIALARPFPAGRTAVVLDFHGKGFLDKKSRNSELFDVLSFSFE